MWLLWKRVTAVGQLLWSTLDFTGSNLTDLATRNHADLQNINTASYTHLSSTNATDLTDGGDSTLHYHSADRYTLPTATVSVLGGVKPDGTTITNTAGAISVTYPLTSAPGSAAYTASTAYDAAGAAAAVTPTTLGLVIGTNTQAHGAKLDSIQALASATGWLHNNGAGVFTYSTPAYTLASADFDNQGTTTTVLHGNAAGNPAWGAVIEADITLAANTTNDVSITKHGFTPVLPNDATKYLDGSGAYSVPVGTAGSTGGYYFAAVHG